MIGDYTKKWMDLDKLCWFLQLDRTWFVDFQGDVMPNTIELQHATVVHYIALEVIPLGQLHQGKPRWHTKDIKTCSQIYRDALGFRLPPVDFSTGELTDNSEAMRRLNAFAASRAHQPPQSHVTMH